MIFRLLAHSDALRLQATQWASNLAFLITGYDCFDQRDALWWLWTGVNLSVILLYSRPTLGLPLQLLLSATTVLGSGLVATALLSKTGAYDDWRRDHPEFINPTRLDLMAFTARSLFSLLTPLCCVSAHPIQVLAITIICITAHLDACQPQTPTPQLNLASLHVGK